MSYNRHAFGSLRATVAVFCVLTAAGIYGATRIPTDSAIERLVVPGDPVAQATLDFERVFPEGDQALLMLESPDPFDPAALIGALARRELEYVIVGGIAATQHGATRTLGLPIVRTSVDHGTARLMEG